MNEKNPASQTPQYTASHVAPQDMHYSAPKMTSAMAITGLVIGIIALLTSFIPIVNNISFFLAILAAIFAIVGLVSAVRGTRAGKGLAIAALAISIVAGAIVLVTQAAYSAALNDALGCVETFETVEILQGADGVSFTQFELR